MEVGVIGLGRMGAAIADCLIVAGHAVTVYNRSPEKAKVLIAKGATLAHDPAGAANGDAVITMLADDSAVESVVFGDEENEGFLPHQGKKTVHISMSTISVGLTRWLASTSEDAGKPFVAAPVMGRPDVAERGELIVMPAGDKGSIARCKDVFEAIGKSTHVVGDTPEKAIIVKLAANFMISSMIETFAEAFALLRKNEIDHQKFMQFMSSEFFQSPVYEKYGKIIAQEQIGTGPFTVRAQEKDTRLALSAAIESQVPMPFLNIIENAFLSAIGTGKGEFDPCAIALVAAENAGIKIKAKR
ncbi:MAG TPA: NAD(P)-dependent oxidoreductase [Planktothrix sp.]|jgi:3-hydroxyisobutyrate dehydrogenase-like beta-hydroxyacid dehydrogenase